MSVLYIENHLCIPLPLLFKIFLQPTLPIMRIQPVWKYPKILFDVVMVTRVMTTLTTVKIKYVTNHKIFCKGTYIPISSTYVSHRLRNTIHCSNPHPWLISMLSYKILEIDLRIVNSVTVCDVIFILLRLWVFLLKWKGTYDIGKGQDKEKLFYSLRHLLGCSSHGHKLGTRCHLHTFKKCSRGLE